MDDGYPCIDGPELTVAGDSVRDNMAIAMCFMKHKYGGPDIDRLLLYYPVTNSCFNSFLPDTMIINGQADVLRDEGEAFGEKLRLAGGEGNSSPGTGDHLRFCHVKCTGSDKCLPRCHGCPHSVAEP